MGDFDGYRFAGTQFVLYYEEVTMMLVTDEPVTGPGFEIEVNAVLRSEAGEVIRGEDHHKCRRHNNISAALKFLDFEALTET